MAANISVTPEQLRGESTHVQERATNAQSDFTALNSRLQNLSSMFTGAAHESFMTAYQEWDGHARGLIESLDALGKFLTTAANTLEETDANLAAGLK